MPVFLSPIDSTCRRSPPPGPRLDPAQHRELFRLIREVAAATGQSMPSAVFLVGDVNAWVGRHGGALGWRCRRTLALGLPLLQVLTVSELRAVLAHEFAHFGAGNLLLGPLVAIGHAIARLGEGWLTRPLLRHATGLLLSCSAVSRSQELRADAPAISLLENVRELERAWLASVSDARQVDKLRALAWESVVGQAHLPL